MSKPKDKSAGLAELAAALCDGEITPEQAARLEQLVLGSEAAQRYFLQYVQIHCELYWEHAAGREPRPEVGVGASPLRRKRILAGRRRPLVYAALAASLLIATALGAIPLYHAWLGGEVPHQPHVAWLNETADAQWEGEAPDEDGGVPTGRKLRLREGFAEIRFEGGAHVILEGPVVFEPQSPANGMLSQGALTVHVPSGTRGFTIGTPRATIVDLGTEFGVVVQQGGPTEVEVFAGKVSVGLGAESAEKQTKHELQAGEALRVSLPAADGQPRAKRVAAGVRHFARSLGGSIARLEALIAADPHLIHHYTFEGDDAQEKRRDGARGNKLDLSEVVMRGGDGGGKIDYSAAGPNSFDKVIGPFRAPQQGNSHGVGLQSQSTFHPPKAMTVELLLSFAGGGDEQDGLVCAAVATRESHRNCGFFVAVVDDGRLVHLMDGQASWLESGFKFVPGKWYYLASTFQAKGDHTIVNTYVADLTKGERTLNWVVRGAAAPGVPSAGRLGIGKGFDGETAHAYPWSGAIDEIAIYDAVLDRSTFQAHLEALAGTGQETICTVPRRSS